MNRRSFIGNGLIGALYLMGSIGVSRPAQADTVPLEGGNKDIQTGLVWSDSYTAVTRSFWTWNGAAGQASAYVVNEQDEFGNVLATYADWRLPTVAELQHAIQNGTLGQLWNRSALPRGKVFVWSGEERGKPYAWAVEVALDGSGTVIPAQSGRAVLFNKKSGFEVFLVRP